MASARDLIVFAYMAGSENRFVPAGRLTLTETSTPNPAARELASAFAYGTRYLERPDSFELDPVSLSLRDRAAVRGQLLYPVNALPEFGGLRDAAPDAWGRRVIEARRKVPANALAEADYLLEAGGDRVGALDVREGLDAPARPSASDLRSLGYLLQAAEAVETGVPVPAHLLDVLGAGPSAGGARPKATVRDDEGGLWLAKFPAHNDAFDVGRAEICTLELARRCGLTVPEVRHCDIGNRSVMLIRRFDRFWANAGEYPPAGPLHETRPGEQRTEARIPFASALTLVGCSEYAPPDKSYGDLAHAIRRYVHPGYIARDNEELFARMVFNIFVSNDDDHLRNHGFIRDPRLGGWQLSPLYDVVPRPGVARERRLHLHIGSEGKAATLDNALSRCTAFFSERAAAIAVIRRVWGEVRQWKTVFESFGAPGQLIDQMTSAIRPLEDIASPALIKELRRR
jgi:serine/threonine-protein kinase HipA